MNTVPEFFDLASELVGGAVMAASDEFFAPKENLIKPGEAQWQADKYTDRGRWMDGWQTRRRRDDGHDWVIVRLGMPGIVRSVVVDTRHFRGDAPESCGLEACALAPGATAAALAGASWRPLVPVAKLEGHSKNTFEISDTQRVTHVRLNIYPDGGIARLRVYGEVLPDWDKIDFRDGSVDLAAFEHGGRVVAVSDHYFASSTNLLLPGRARTVGDGWETQRRRDRSGNDWVIIKLGAKGTIERAELDTWPYRGAAPAACSIEVCDTADDSSQYLTGPSCTWQVLLPRTPLSPDARHIFDFDSELIGAPAATHARLRIYPDGGVARVRLFGTTERSASIRTGIARLNALNEAELESKLLSCCGATAWAHAMVAARPFADFSTLVRTADVAWSKLDKFDWIQAFAAHPRLGEASGDDLAAKWTRAEQAALKEAPADVLEKIAEMSKYYYERFGHNVVVLAAGKSASDILAMIMKRKDNEAAEELKVAAEEQRKITRLRLGKLLRAMTPKGASNALSSTHH